MRTTMYGLLPILCTVNAQFLSSSWMDRIIIETHTTPAPSHRPPILQITEEGINTFHSYTLPNGERVKMEVRLSFGMKDEWILIAEDAILKFYSGKDNTSGDSANSIGDFLEHNIGGYWSVAFVDDPDLIAYTVSRRPIYALFQINGGGGVLISSSGGKVSQKLGFRQGTPFGAGK